MREGTAGRRLGDAFPSRGPTLALRGLRRERHGRRRPDDAVSFPIPVLTTEQVLKLDLTR
ncbi:hypothetical protein WJ87_28505 [Burkholderia ubonensis]|nr:hypothetical protein WJ87_28505 [Burkholderia ubonensis]